MLYQLSYASRKPLTLAKRKPNCKGFCAPRERDEQALRGRFVCAFLFFYASEVFDLKPTSIGTVG